jgi:hypothetical protein
MAVRSIGGLAAALLFFASAAAARSATTADPCWQLLYKALEQSAAGAHAPFISYAENIHITQDGHRYEFANALVTYRDDGLAYVDDDRWVHPFVSRVLEPGPPVLGPYGPSRASWLSLEEATNPKMRVIAETHNYQHTCVDEGDQSVEGKPAAHLVIPDAAPDHPALKEIWIDRSSLQVRRAVVSQYLTLLYDYSGKKGQQLVDYTIQVEQLNGYNVIKQVNWEYTYRVFSQYSTISAEYTFGGFVFRDRPPSPTLFATTQ